MFDCRSLPCARTQSYSTILRSQRMRSRGREGFSAAAKDRVLVSDTLTSTDLLFENETFATYFANVILFKKRSHKFSIPLLNVGSYSDSAGVEIIRRHIAQYITERDGVPSKYEDVFLCTGASDGIKVLSATSGFFFGNVVRFL